jgi:hypothetical protein
MDRASFETEFLGPLVSAWCAKIERSRESRSDWADTAEECMMFYSRSARAMWDPSFSKRFWKNVEMPRFRVTINKAFELVAVFGPNLMWEVPHRTVKSKKMLEIPQELLQDEEMGPILQEGMQQQMAEKGRDKVVAHLMSAWLNYTPREQPDGGLAGHSERAKVDALLTGRGCLISRNYRMPGSERTLVGSFHVDPRDVFLDPDFKRLSECRWVAIKHVQPYHEVEKKFGLKRDSLKGKMSVESNWHYAERTTSPDAHERRQAGQSGDNIVWYEIWSKGGVGARCTSMDEKIKYHMEEVVGQHAYLAICPDVRWPLNMPAEKMRSGATDDEVRDAFQWPVPLWADDRWPIKFLDFYPDPDSAWPVAPLAPGLGELKLLNLLVSWLANRVWKSGRDFWSVAGPYVEHYRDYLESGSDMSIIPAPIGVEDISKAVSVLQQPESRQDIAKMIEFISGMFDKRVGLTAFAYGLNVDNTQNRTAEETVAKSRAISARPEFMMKQVVDWQAQVAQSEAFLTRWFVTADDVRPLVGDIGAMLWSQYIESTDVELVTRQFEYTVDAASIRRPNRDRDVANYQQVTGLWMPVIQQYGQQSGNYGPLNYLMKMWGEYHDCNMEEAMIPPPPEPDPEQEEMQKMGQQLELAKVQAEIEKLQADAQSKVQGEDPVKAEMEAERAMMQLEMQRAKAEQDLETGASKSVLELLQGQAKHDAEMVQGQEIHEAKMLQQLVSAGRS